MFKQRNRFTDKYSFEERIRETTKILYLHPERVPVICERASAAPNDCPKIDKNKYLVPRDFSLGQFIYTIRKRLNLEPEKAIFLFVNGSIMPLSLIFNVIYESCKSPDGFLYITYSFENTFG